MKVIDSHAAFEHTIVGETKLDFPTSEIFRKVSPPLPLPFPFFPLLSLSAAPAAIPTDNDLTPLQRVKVFENCFGILSVCGRSLYFSSSPSFRFILSIA